MGCMPILLQRSCVYYFFCCFLFSTMTMRELVLNRWYQMRKILIVMVNCMGLRETCMSVVVQ